MAATATKKKPAKLTAAQYKELLGDTQKEVKVELKKNDLVGKWDTVVKRIKKMVDASEIVGDWKITATSGGGYSRYDYRTRSYVYPAPFTIVGYRPYTDEEIEQNGATLLRKKLAAEERAEKARAANIKKFNKLAEQLGVEAITED